jgi:protein-tyrosine-phosphatase
MTELPATVLFACTYNAARSPMAEALLRHFHGLTITVKSVGVFKGEPDPFAAAAMEEIGIPIARHKPSTFEELDEEAIFDLVISLSPEAQHHAVEMTRDAARDVLFWNILDPTLIEGSREVRMDAYRGVRDQLKARILERFPLSPLATPPVERRRSPR